MPLNRYNNERHDLISNLIINKSVMFKSQVAVVSFYANSLCNNSSVAHATSSIATMPKHHMNQEQMIIIIISLK